MTAALAAPAAGPIPAGPGAPPRVELRLTLVDTVPGGDDAADPATGFHGRPEEVLHRG